MSYWRTAILILGVATTSTAVAFAQDAAGRMRWKNGDELTGQLIGAVPGEVIWRAAALSEQVEVDMAVLDTIFLDQNRPAAPAGEEKETEEEDGRLRVLLSGGLVLLGDLAAITDQHVVLQTERHGKVTLKRSWVESFQRSVFDGGTIDLLGNPTNKWRSVDPKFASKQPPLADWDVSEPDRVVTRMPGARLYLPARLPDICDIELSLQSTGRPAFSLALGASRHLQARTGNLEIETWGDRLVVTSPASEKPFAFEYLELLESDRRTVTLRVFWNRKTGKVSVFGPRATLLAEADIALAPDILTGGVLLESKGADLTVTRLSVNPWNAEQSPQIITGQDRLRTKSGREHYGIISGPDEHGELSVQPREGDVVKVPESDVAAILLTREPVDPAPPDGCELLFADGSVLRGELQKISAGVVTLLCRSAAEPIETPLAEVVECRFISPPPADAPPFDYLLESAGKRLRGTLATVGTELGWRLEGARNVIPLDLNHPVTIRRVQPSTNVSGDTPAAPGQFTRVPDDMAANDENPDTLVLASGEQLPCKVETIDEGFVSLSSSFSAAVRIPQANVRAVTLGNTGSKEIHGFGDDEWQIGGEVPKQIERHSDRIVFHDQASATHPTLLSGGSLDFDVAWNRDAQTYLMINILARNDEADANRARHLRGGGFIAMGHQQRMFYLFFHQGQVVVHVMEGNGFRQMNVQQQLQFESPIHCRIQVIDEQIVLALNDRVLGEMSFPAEESTALGVTFHTQAVQIRNGQQQGGDVGMTISNLRAGRASGLFHQLPISKTAREYVTTVPRMRRDRPPSHVLVGRNGDLLRGGLLSLGPTSALFQSRLDEVTIPRDRVAGIIWPLPPVEAPPNDNDIDEGPERPVEDEATATDNASAVDNPTPQTSDTPAAAPGGSIRATFASGVVMELVLDRVEEDALVARHPVFGECRLNLSDLVKLDIGTPGTPDDDVAAAPTFTEWSLVHAREPVIPGASGGFGTHSALVGQPAEDFSIPLLSGGDFRLSEQRGKIVVLDFWATWCGPCIQAMPQLTAATAAFPEDVVFVGVNQDESREIIQAFLDSREWKLTVGLDRGGAVGQKYEVQGIPQTVVIGRDGTIEHVHLGASPDLESALKEVLGALATGESLREP